MMELSRPFVVTTIGTCRIADPIIAATKTRPLKRANRRVYGFVHTSAEILQQIDCLQGREIPADIAPFIVGPEKTAKDVLTDPDLFIVEVSTVKQIRFGEWVLQINHMDRAFEGFRPLLEVFNRFKSINERDARRAALEQLPLFAEASAIQKSILLDGFVRMTTRDELERDLAEINRRLPAPIVFSCHIDVDGLDGTPLPARRQLCGWMRELCAAHGYTFVDPTPQVVAYGQTRALAQSGRDLNHYAEKYKPLYGCYLYDQFCEPIIQGAKKPLAAAVPVPNAVVEPLESAPVVSGKSAATRDPASEAIFQSLIDRARKNVNRGQLAEAEALLAQAEQEAPEAQTLLGTIAFHRVENAKAEAHLRAALRRNPDSVEAKMMLVKVLHRMSAVSEAAQLSNDLLRDAPGDAKALIVAAKALTKAKHYPSAILAWQSVAALRPNEAAGLIEAARCKLKLKDFPEAVTIADAALAREPGSTVALGIKAEALDRLGNIPDLAEVLLQIAARDPELAMASVPSLISSGHPLQAAAVVAASRAAGSVGANDPALHASMIRILAEQGKGVFNGGDVQGAVKAWKAVQLLDPDHKQASVSLRAAVEPFVIEGRSLAASGDLAASAQALRSGLAIDERNARVLRELASVLERAGDLSEAADAWFALSQIPGGGQEALMRGARCAVRGKHTAKALDLFQRLNDDDRAKFAETIASNVRRLIKAMREDFEAGNFDDAQAKAKVILLSDPENIAAERIRHKILSATVKLMRAAASDLQAQKALGEKILAIDPNHPEALRTMGKLHTLSHNHREAMAVYERLTEIEPGDSRHWIKLAAACRGSMQYEAGTAAALKAMEIEPGNVQAIDILSGMLNRQAIAA